MRSTASDPPQTKRPPSPEAGVRGSNEVRKNFYKGGRAGGLGAIAPCVALWADWGDACPCGGGATRTNKNRRGRDLWKI